MFELLLGQSNIPKINLSMRPTTRQPQSILHWLMCCFGWNLWNGGLLPALAVTLAHTPEYIVARYDCLLHIDSIIIPSLSWGRRFQKPIQLYFWSTPSTPILQIEYMYTGTPTLASCRYSYTVLWSTEYCYH